MINLILVGLSTAFLFTAISLLGWRRADYSWIRHTISELGEKGSVGQSWVSFGVFLPVGLTLAIVAFRLQDTSLPQALLATCLSVGYTVAAIFPCDPGSPATGSVRQGIHNLGGGVEYVGGAFSLFWIAESLGPSFRIAGFVVGAAMLALAAPNPVRGLIQRVAEVGLLGGLFLSLIRVAS